MIVTIPTLSRRPDGSIHVQWGKEGRVFASVADAREELRGAFRDKEFVRLLSLAFVIERLQNGNIPATLAGRSIEFDPGSDTPFRLI